MGAQENAELIQSGYEAFAKGDLDTVSKVFGSDIRWTIGGRNQLAGTYVGHDEVFGFFGRLVELTDGTFSLAVHDVLASDDHVVVLATASASRNGTSLKEDEAHVWHVAGGKATEFWGLSSDQHAVDEFWA